MAKKSGKPPKRKKSCLRGCGCCLGVFAIIMAVLVGIGWFLGDGWTRKNADQSLLDAFGTAGNLYFYNESKIVKNGFKAEDANNAYSKFKRQLFLKDEFEFNAGVLTDFMGLGGGNGAKTALLYGGADGQTDNALYGGGAGLYGGLDNPLLYDGEGENAGENENGGGAGAQTGDAMTKILDKLLKKENFNFERLQTYGEANHGDYLLKIKDNELAALADDVLKALSKAGKLDFGGLKISAGIKQLTLKGTGVENVPNENGVFNSTPVVTAELTVRLSTRETFNAFVDKSLGGNGFIKFLAGFLIPKDTFVTAEVGLTRDVPPAIRINEADAGKMDKSYKLISALIKQFTGNALNIQEEMTAISSKTVYPIAATLQDIFHFENVERIEETNGVVHGMLNLDPWRMLIDAGGVNKDKPESEHITSVDLLTALKGMVAVDADAVFTDGDGVDSRYEDVYREPGADKGIQPDGGYIAAEDYAETKRFPAPAVIEDGYTLVNYKDEFIQELNKKYNLTLTADNFADVMKLFGIGEKSGGEEITDLADVFAGKGQNFTDLLNGNQNAVAVNVNDRMMAAVINDMFGDIFGGGPLAGAGYKTESLLIESYEHNGKTHAYFTPTVSVPISGLIKDGGNAVANALMSLVAEKLYFKFKVDVTDPATLGDALRQEATLFINNLTAAETDRLRKLLKTAGGVDFDAILGDVQTKLRDTVAQMREAMPGTEFKPSTAVLSSVFDYIAKNTLEDEISAGELKAVLREIDKVNLDGEGRYTDNTEYYESGKITNAASDAAWEAFLTAYAGSPSSPPTFLSDSALAGLLKYQMQNGDAYMDVAGGRLFHYVNSVREVTVYEKQGGKFMDIIIEVEAETLIAGQNADMYAKLLPADKLFLTYTVELSAAALTAQGADPNYEPPHYSATLTVNDMAQGGAEYANLVKMINKLSSGALNLEKTAKDIGYLVYREMVFLTSGSFNGAVDYDKIVDNAPADRTGGGINNPTIDLASFIGNDA